MNYAISMASSTYLHKRRSVTMNNHVKVIWDTTIWKNTRPGITLVHKTSYVAVLLDKNIVKVKQAKIQTYQDQVGQAKSNKCYDLARQIEEIYKAATQIAHLWLALSGLFPGIFQPLKTSW